MPNTSGGKVTSLATETLRYNYRQQPGQNSFTPGIVTGGPEDWFGPLNPQAPSAPPEVAGRRFDFPSGYNLNIEPRAYEPISFGQLRELADAYDVLRTIIETRKDQMAKLKWAIKPRDLGDGKSAIENGSPLIKEITAFFEMPDGEQFWDTWLRVLLEDLFVLDAPTLFIERARGGKMLALQPIDGQTVKRIIDDYGRTPKAPVPAYQQCYSDDTEVLTRRGWLRFCDVDAGADEVATRNPETKAFEWQRPTAKTERDYTGPMLRFSSRMLDIMVSPEHRMLVDRLPRALGCHPHRKGEAFVTAQELADNYTVCTRIPLASQWAGKRIEARTFSLGDKHEQRLELDDQARELRAGGLSYSQVAEVAGTSMATAYRACTLYAERGRMRQPQDGFPVTMSGDDFCAFMGAYLAEGSLTADGISIAQTEKGAGFEQFCALLDRIAPGRVQRLPRRFAISSLALKHYCEQFGHAADKWIPAEIMDATPDQLALFWQYFHLGDGDRDRARVFTASRCMADQLQELCQKLGSSASIRAENRSTGHIVENGVERTIKRSGPLYSVSIRRHHAGSVRSIETIDYDGKIWCLSVPNTTLYVRRNGNAAWCGNCLHGLPAVNYTTRDLIYRPRNLRAHKVYGLSPVEQIVMTVNIALRRQAFLMSYYTEGNVPEALIGVPEAWSTKQIAEFQDWFDTTLSGNLAQRRRARFVPNGIGKTFIDVKEGALTDQTDEWLTRVCCFAFSIAPTPFVKQVNRATAENAKAQALAEGLWPIQQWVKQLVDYVIRTEWQTRDVEFGWELDDDVDPAVQMQVLTGYVTSGVLSINEARDRLGEEAVDGGDVPMALLATGWEPVDMAEKVSRIEQMPLPPAPAPADGNTNDTKPGEDKPPAKSKPNAKEVGEAAKSPLADGLCKAADGSIRPGEYTVSDASQDDASARALARTIAARLKAIGVTVTDQVLEALTQYAVTSQHESQDEDAQLEQYRLLADRIGDSVDLTTFNELIAPISEALAETATTASADTLDVFFGGSAPEDITNLVNQRAVAQAEARAAELVGMTRNAAGDWVPNPNAARSITDTTRDMIRRTVANGLAENIGNQGIIDRLKELGFSAGRAELVAFTEIANANSAAALESMKETRARGGNIKKAWLTAGDDKVEEVCLANEEAGPIDLDEPFPSGDQHPLAHPRCRCALRAIVTRTW